MPRNQTSATTSAFAWNRPRRITDLERPSLPAALLLAFIDPQPLAQYLRWLKMPTLVGLPGLLIAVHRDSGMVHTALVLLAHSRAPRMVGLPLGAATALLYTLLAKEESLFLIVPLTLTIGTASNLPMAHMRGLRRYGRMPDPRSVPLAPRKTC